MIAMFRPDPERVVLVPELRKIVRPADVAAFDELVDQFASVGAPPSVSAFEQHQFQHLSVSNVALNSCADCYSDVFEFLNVAGYSGPPLSMHVRLSDRNKQTTQTPSYRDSSLRHCCCTAALLHCCTATQRNVTTRRQHESNTTQHHNICGISTSVMLRCFVAGTYRMAWWRNLRVSRSNAASCDGPHYAQHPAKAPRSTTSAQGPICH
jgi:hypothetical protein